MRILALVSLFVTLLCTGAIQAKAECSNWECDCTNGNVSEVGSRAECTAECRSQGSRVASVSPPECGKHGPAPVLEQVISVPGHAKDCTDRDRCVEGCERAGLDDAATARCERSCAKIRCGDSSSLQDVILLKKAHDGNECTPDYIASECDECNLEPKCTKKCVHELGCD